MKDKWSLIAYIKRGINRKKVFESIEEPVMPSEIVKKIYGKSSNTHFNIVSRALSELKKEGLVSVKNPKDKTGRMYELTKIGKDIRKRLS